jgi:acetoin utilization protein AcuB
MLVKDCMVRHPIIISPEMPAAELERIMSENRIRHVPVVGDGKELVGLVTRHNLSMRATEMDSLNVWEITRFLSNLKVKDIMVKAEDVVTISPERTIERAASIMTHYKYGCLPVIDESRIVIGLLTQIDLLQAFQEMLGLPAEGIRVTIRMPDKKGQFVKMAAVLVEKGFGVMGIGSFPSPRNPGFYDVVVKIPHATCDEVREALSQIEGQEIVDIRDAV